MKWVLMSLENFSPRGLKKKSKIDNQDLPKIMQYLIDRKELSKFIILDESSKIKTNTPMAEKKKSSRTRLVKTLNSVGDRCCLTGTMMSKSPVNAYDQFNFLQDGYFKEDIFTFAEKYCIMETLPIGRGRRVLISKKSYDKIRKQLVGAYKAGGKEMLNGVASSISRFSNISMENIKLILKNKKYTPFKNIEELRKRITPITISIKRSDCFDITNEYYVNNPIDYPVEISEKAKKIGNNLVKLGFSENITLKGSASLELYHRLQDLCNGLEPIREDLTDEIEYKELKENPKLDAIEDLLEFMNYEENQIVIFSSRTNFTNLISSRLQKLEIPFVTYTGSDKEKDKALAQEKMLDGEARIMLANPTSAGYGLNCLKNATYIINACVDASVEKFVQSKARILRGQLEKPKFVYNLFIKNSVEERVYASLAVGEELLTGETTRSIYEF